MQTKQWILFSAIAIAAGAAMADEAADSSTSPTREQVVQSVLAARAAHQLRPAGAAGDDPYGWRSEPVQASHLSRTTVENEVMAARASHTLRPAGEAGDDMNGWVSSNGPSTVARAQVVAETLQARANGELIPAGEGPVGGHEDYSTHFAHVKTPTATVHAAAPHADSTSTQ